MIKIYFFKDLEIYCKTDESMLKVAKCPARRTKFSSFKNIEIEFDLLLYYLVTWFILHGFETCIKPILCTLLWLPCFSLPEFLERNNINVRYRCFHDYGYLYPQENK